MFITGSLSSHALYKMKKDKPRLSAGAHGNRLTSVSVLFTKIMRKQVVNYGQLTDTIGWPLRCFMGMRDLPQLFAIKLN